MAKRRSGALARLTALSMAMLLSTLSVVVPLMDGSDRFAGPSVEAEHDGSVCALHDHTVCMQVGANQALSENLATTGRVSPVIPSVMPVSVGPVSGPLRSEPPPARAPPHQRG